LRIPIEVVVEISRKRRATSSGVRISAGYFLPLLAGVLPLWYPGMVTGGRTLPNLWAGTTLVETPDRHLDVIAALSLPLCLEIGSESRWERLEVLRCAGVVAIEWLEPEPEVEKQVAANLACLAVALLARPWDRLACRLVRDE
jgi:hypothetical protein